MTETNNVALWLDSMSSVFAAKYLHLLPASAQTVRNQDYLEKAFKRELPSFINRCIDEIKTDYYHNIETGIEL